MTTSPAPQSRSGPLRTLRWFLLVPLLLGSLGLFAFFGKEWAARKLAVQSHAAAVEPVSVIHPKRSAPSRELVLPATLQAYTQAPIYARTSGYVAHWYADIGQFVHRDELLAQIDAPEVDQQVARKKAVLDQAQANLTLAATTAQRFLGLLQSNAVSQQEVDQNNQNFAAQQALVASAKADLKEIQQQQDYERVVAPFDGIVTERIVDVGDLVNSGNGGKGAELFRLCRIDVMRVFVDIPEAYSEEIADGQEVTLQLTELPGQIFTGKVARTSHAITVSSRTMQVEVDVPNLDGKLMPGAYGLIHFQLADAVRPLVVPSGAVLFQAPGPQVAVVNAQNRIELRKVSLGKDFGTEIEITHGLSPDDQVVATPPDYVVNGMEVSVQKTLDQTAAGDS